MNISSLSSSACAVHAGSLAHGSHHTGPSHTGQYGAATAGCVVVSIIHSTQVYRLLQVLLAVYMVVVVMLVRRQIFQMREVEEEEKEEDSKIMITDMKGKTDVKCLDEVLCDYDEVLM